MKKRLAWITPAFVICAAATIARGQEINVALATVGASVRADSEYITQFGAKAFATRLIDGVIPAPGAEAEWNRWHTEPWVSHPHWLWIRFARPAKISKVVLWHSGAASPADFFGQCTVDDGRSLQTLFHKETSNSMRRIGRSRLSSRRSSATTFDC